MSILIASDFAFILAQLGIKKIHHGPYKSWAKGTGFHSTSCKLVPFFVVDVATGSSGNFSGQRTS
jgi:hypothetical protein